MLGKLWHIRRVVLGLKTILKGELDHKEEFVPLFEEEQSYRTHLR